MYPSRVQYTPNENTDNLYNQQSQNTYQLLDDQIVAYRSLALQHCRIYRNHKTDEGKAKTESDRIKCRDAADEAKKMVDDFNCRAVKCILELHYVTHQNQDILDLHRLMVEEATQCLEFFLEAQTQLLKMGNLKRKDVFIITGRGVHSKGRSPKIKPMVERRLRERNLMWCVDINNAGHLKVEVLDTS